MLRFKQFILEYLTPEEKQDVSTWEPRTPEATKATDHFFGVGNDEHHEPLVDTGDKSEIHKAIERHLGQPISHEEYKSGMLSGNKRIGNVISNPELKIKFKTDNTRKNIKANQLSVRTTRSAEGVAGQTSHGQSWENHSCKNFNDGSNSHYLRSEVMHGTVVSYLHDHKGNELARATFQPFINDEGNVIYKKDSHYGLNHPEFEKHNEAMELRLSQPHRGSPEYNIHPSVYNDSGVDSALHPQFIQSLIKDKDADPEHIMQAIHETSDTKTLKKLFRHKNLTEKHINILSRTPYITTLRKHLIEHPNVTDESLSNIARNVLSTDTETLRKIHNHPKTGDLTLASLAHNTHNNTILNGLYKDPRAGDNTIAAIASKIENPETHRKILKDPRIGTNTLYTLAHPDNTHLHHDIISHPVADDRVLSRIGRHTTNPETLDKIANHSKVGKMTRDALARNPIISKIEPNKLIDLFKKINGNIK